MRVKPDFYRKKAIECRELVKKATDSEARSLLLSIAEQYDKLFEMAEAEPK